MEHLKDSGSDELNAGTYEADADMTSVVSYPKRCAAWGDWRFRGNCDGRLFLNLVQKYRPRTVADPMVGSGTTQHVIDGLNRERQLGIRFWGSDLRDGFDLTRDELPGQFDFVWVHPPYWNMIRYSDNPSDLSACPNYADFIEQLTDCLGRCQMALSRGGHLAVLIGDMRRSGVYYPLGRDVMSMEHRLGPIRSVIVKVQHNCVSDKKAYTNFTGVPIKHEYCVIFGGM